MRRRCRPGRRHRGRRARAHRSRRRSRWPASRPFRRSASRRRADRSPRASRGTRPRGRWRDRSRRLSSATSASTVGRPRESQTRRRLTRAIAIAHRIVLSRRQARDQRLASAAETGSRDGAIARTRGRASFVGAVGQVLDRRLAVDAREQSAGQQRGDALFAVRGRLPRDARQVSRRQRSEGVDIARAPLRLPRALQQQVIQHEREIERRVAVPRAFGVEDHRALPARSTGSSG